MKKITKLYRILDTKNYTYVYCGDKTYYLSIAWIKHRIVSLLKYWKGNKEDFIIEEYDVVLKTTHTIDEFNKK